MANPKPSETPAELPFAPSGFFALRTPLLPFDTLRRWAEGLEAPHAQGEAALGPALDRDRATLRGRLRELLQRPEVREAIFVASPVLHESFELWDRTPEGERGQKVERSLVRYLSRMAGRATPFGLFAGCSVGTLGEHTKLRVAARGAYQRHTRLDMDYVYALTDVLARLPPMRPHLLHRPNTSLVEAGGRLRYAEGRAAAMGREYHLVAIDPSDYLHATLERARAGAKPADLARALHEADPTLSAEEAWAYVQELIDSQILVPDLLPAVTGPEPLPGLIAQVREIPEVGKHLGDRLEQVRAAIERIDEAGLGAPIDRYQRIAAALSELPAPVELPRLFQVDMVKPAPEAALGQNVVRELSRAAQLLHRVAPPWEDVFARFRERFTERYETREVPLLEVLDEELGIGFESSSAPAAEAAPLLHGIALGSGESPRSNFGPRELHLLHLLEEAGRTGAQVVTLTDEDVEALESKERPPLPDAFAVMATVAAESEAAIASGRFQLCLDALTGPSGANLLGRFCHGDPELHRKVEEHLRAEEALRPEAVFAEIVHLPMGRVGNILARPVLREYEIPYLGRSGAPPERQLPPEDLRVSVQGGRVVLRSVKLGREVIPRLSNAHAYARMSIGVYRFLCVLQLQERSGSLAWSWGPLGEARFLPRLVYGKTVLSLAKWKLEPAALAPLQQATGAERFSRVQALRRELRLPRFVALEDGDNVLPVDLDNVLSVETFVHLIKKRSAATLVETFPAPDALCAEGPEGRFVHELVVPFVRTRRLEPEPRRLPTRATPHGVRSFPPGSEWLYLRLYTGTATADRILTDAVGPLVKSALERGLADRWFFVRFSDPRWHLRLRFHGEPERLHALGQELLAELAPLHRDGRIWRMQLDTYEREVERYGGPEGIALSEQLFHIDSEAALELLALSSGDEGAEARWRLTLRGMDALLSDLGLDLAAKLDVMKSVRFVFGEEFRVDGAVERQLGDKFRKERKETEALLDPAKDAESPLAPGLEVLRRRSERLAPIAAELRALRSRGALTASVGELGLSYLHMHANRMLRSAARAQELVLYDLLSRHYASLEARQRKGRPAG